MCLSCSFEFIVLILIPNDLMIFFASNNKLGSVFSVSHKIITLSLNKSFFAELGPENSVPAIG